MHQPVVNNPSAALHYEEPQCQPWKLAAITAQRDLADLTGPDLFRFVRLIEGDSFDPGSHADRQIAQQVNRTVRLLRFNSRQYLPASVDGERILRDLEKNSVRWTALIIIHDRDKLVELINEFGLFTKQQMDRSILSDRNDRCLATPFRMKYRHTLCIRKFLERMHAETTAVESPGYDGLPNLRFNEAHFSQVMTRYIRQVIAFRLNEPDLLLGDESNRRGDRLQLEKVVEAGKLAWGESDHWWRFALARLFSIQSALIPSQELNAIEHIAAPLKISVRSRRALRKLNEPGRRRESFTISTTGTINGETIARWLDSFERLGFIAPSFQSTIQQAIRFPFLTFEHVPIPLMDFQDPSFDPFRFPDVLPKTPNRRK